MRRERPLTGTQPGSARDATHEQHVRRTHRRVTWLGLAAAGAVLVVGALAATAATDIALDDAHASDDDPVVGHPDEPTGTDGSDPLLGATLEAAEGDRWWLERLAAPAARDRAAIDEPAVVAVLDSSPDLARAGVDSDRALDPIQVIEGDHHRHGTAAAALAGGDPKGTCTDCKVLPITVLPEEGHGRASDLAAGIDEAVEAGADVISMSLGGAMGSDRMEDAVQGALDEDILLVAAAGNVGTDEAFYPGAYDGVLSVASHDEDGRRYDWSSFGDWVTVAAPSCPSLPMLEGSSTFCGTSASTPMIAGVAGLLRSAVPEASAAQVLEAIADSDDELGFVEHGEVDALAALEDLVAEVGVDLDADGDDEIAARDVVLDELPDDADEAAAALSEQRFADGEADGALVTRSDAFPDALSGSTLAGERPVLYAEGDSVPEVTLEELDRVLGDDATVLVLGGEGALGSGVTDQLAEVADDVERLAGEDRIATALAVAETVEAPDAAFLARSDEWADAVAVGGPAAATETPVLLTDSDALDERVAAFLDEHDIEDVTLLGGDAALDDDVATQVAEVIGTEPQRIAGAMRTETSALIADGLVDRSGAGAVVIGGFEDDGWTTGLAASPLAASRSLPILLTRGDGTLCGHAHDELAARWSGEPLRLTAPGSLAAPAMDSVDELSAP